MHQYQNDLLIQTDEKYVNQDAQECFDDMNLTLSKLCGLRRYKAKYKHTASTVADVQSNFTKLHVKEKWVRSSQNKKKDIKMMNRMAKIK